MSGCFLNASIFCGVNLIPSTSSFLGLSKIFFKKSPAISAFTGFLKNAINDCFIFAGSGFPNNEFNNGSIFAGLLNNEFNNGSIFSRLVKIVINICLVNSK